MPIGFKKTIFGGDLNKKDDGIYTMKYKLLDMIYRLQRMKLSIIEG